MALFNQQLNKGAMPVKEGGVCSYWPSSDFAPETRAGREDPVKRQPSRFIMEHNQNSELEPGSGRQEVRHAGSRGREHLQETVQERTAISAQVVYEAIRAEGEEELRRPTSALAFSGLAAGLSMGFSFLTEGFLRAGLPPGKVSELVSKLGYSVGFLIIILGRQQLFTENTLTPVIPLLKHKRWATLLNLLRLWTTVFVANWVGTLIIAWVLGRSELISDGARAAFEGIGQRPWDSSFELVLLKGVFAGWLIALLVWLLPFAETGRVAVIVVMTYVIALGSFTHVVAGSVDTFYLVVRGMRTWNEYLVDFMFPTFIGNVLGGVALVAALNHAQVTAGRKVGT
jgi:formate-nitrite transporter family protein